jgi:hypothetical protein
MKFGPPGKYGGDPIPVPVFYVLAIYQDTFRDETRVIEIRTAEPLSPICVGDYLYEVSFPEPLVVPRGHILQVVAKQHIISTHPDDGIIHTTMLCVNAVLTPEELF